MPIPETFNPNTARKQKRLKISDHALARYCERFLGLDTAAVTQSLVDLIGPELEGRHKLPGVDIVAVVVDGVVVNFVPDGPLRLEVFKAPFHPRNGKKEKQLRISDHALVRYCERMLGLDKAIVRRSLADLIGPMEAGRRKLPGLELVAVVTNGVVVTFAPASPGKLAFKKPKSPTDEPHTRKQIEDHYPEFQEASPESPFR